MEGREEPAVRISVRNLVEFILRSGDLDNRRTAGAKKEAMLAGGRLHRKLQRAMGANYRAEVSLKCLVQLQELSVLVEGRADGILAEADGEVIDEIKCIYMDVRRLEEADPIYGFSVKEVNPSYFDLKYHGSNTGVIMEYAYALSGNPANYYKIDQNMKTGRIPYGSLDPNKTEADYPEVQQVLNEIRSFLNSFDFKNASDLEKAQKAAAYVSRASYDYGTYESIQDGNAAYEDNWQTASIYGCLVNKKCVCAGCSDAFRTLVRMMGLPCITESTRDHQWDYVRIDGQWWMHSNGNLYRPGETERLANGYTVPSFENSPTNRCFGEGNPNYYMNWAYQP